MRKQRVGNRGFSLTELVVVMAIMSFLLLLGIPELRKLLAQAKMETSMADIRASFQRARFEAIKHGRQVVVQAQPDERRVRVYIDEPEFDGSGNRTDTPFAYEPAAGLPASETDRVVQEAILATGIEFLAPQGQRAAEGFSNLSGGDASSAEVSELVAVFGPPGGAVEDLGAFRLGDSRQNFLEVRVDIAATGKVISRKYDCDDGEWKERDDERDSPAVSPWTWYWSRSSC